MADPDLQAVTRQAQMSEDPKTATRLDGSSPSARSGLPQGKPLTQLVDTAKAEGAREAIARWQPIETAPKDGTYLLLASSAYGRVIGAHVVGDVWHLVGIGTVTSGSERPTHWMSLPDSPSPDDTLAGSLAPTREGQEPTPAGAE